ncbi:hypothetical protein AB1K83_13395 [Sporosarcina sp. 179-K 3D1 HS]|uniref:DUF7225 domain-containing protein n=1 Tax=Sporosarcina sp. 179-K 3D1 HS TaxID=3232169 RepID=UPI0039A2B059
MKIYDQLREILLGREGEIVTTKKLKFQLENRYGTNPGSIILSDYCYNRWNKGISFNQHLFEYVTKSTYKYLGERAAYTGLIFHRPKGAAQENVVGEWRAGVKLMYTAEQSQGIDRISADQINRLYEEYNRILRYEMQVLQCRPTELRHLIGRIGELLCAMMTGGYLARHPNQHGFDVVSEGKRISVKTTAQKTGFIVFNRNTFAEFDEIFIVQYHDDDFHIVYHGPKEPIEQIARIYGHTYEVDMERVKKFSANAMKL